MEKVKLNPLSFFLFIIFIGFANQNYVYSQNISFNQTSLNFNGFQNIDLGTSLQFGPDERLYVAQLKGEIKIYTISKEGPNQYDVVGEEVLLGVKSLPNHDDNGLLAFDNRDDRQITGLTVVGTAENPIIYVSSSDPKWGGPIGDKFLDTNSGVITRLSWNGASWEAIDLVRGLPRSEENHSTNGLEFTTINGKPYLLVASGGLTNAGSPSKNFTYITEVALSAAILSIDLEAIEALPTQTDSHSGRLFKYDIPTLDDPSRENVNGVYDPNDPNYNGLDVNDPFGGNDGLNMGMVTEDGPVQIFSPGYRNSYDLVVTEDRKLFVTDNGANINWGGLPLNEGDATLVSNAYDPEEPGASPLNPSASGEFVDNQDHLLLVTTDLDTYQPGSFYGGHPTPIRANPGTAYTPGAAFPFEPGGAGLYTKFIGDNENYKNVTPAFTPTDQFRTQILEPVAPGQPGFDAYAANSLPANWPPVPASMANAAEADFIAPTMANPNGTQPSIVTIFPNNSNGIAEYKGTNFEGAIKGSLVVGKNGGTLHLIHLNEDGSLKEAEFSKWNLNGGNALGIATNGDGEVFPGTIWIATFDNRIMVLTPADDVFCIPVDDPDFDPTADYDFDGYTNQDELDNGTDYCSGASAPDDYDKDLVSNLNDLDDDGDGILDKDDPFQVGFPRDLPLENQLFTNQSDASGNEFGYLGLGLTGLMNNGSDNPNWLEWLDKGNDSPGPPDIYGGTAGAIQVSMTGGTANGTANNQDKGFQLGVNVGTETGNYTISSGLIGLSSPGQLYDFDGNGEVGIQIGDGSQSNFVKLVFTKDGISAVQEIDDSVDVDSLFLEIPADQRADANTLIKLSFDVNPVDGTIEPKYAYNNDSAISLGTMTAKGAVKEAIQNSAVPLAIGIYGSSHDPEKSFIAVWSFFEASGEIPFSIRSLRDVNRLMGDPDVQINLQEYFGDDDGLNNLTFSVAGNSNPVIGASVEGNMLRLIIPNDEVTSTITVRATDANGYFIEQSFAVIVEQDFEILLRINAGGEVLTDENGAPNWLANKLTGPEVTSNFSVSGGRSATNSFSADQRHESIPAYISDEQYVQIFNKERYATEETMEYQIPLPNGDYLVNLYMGNGFSGTSGLLNRYFTIEIEEETVATSLDLVETFGHLIGGMMQFPATVVDGELSISFLKQKENPLVNGIEIIGKPIQVPIEFTAIKDQINFAGFELDGSMFVSASGGNGNLSYAAEGLPPGVYLEPTNGTIYGKIEDGALANSPYRITITIDDEDEIHSDSKSFNFTWTISPDLIDQTWKARNEDTTYTGRHENSFVQAGDKFYLLGGRESSKTIDIYDYSNDEWRSLPNINPYSFNHFQAVSYEGLIWVIAAFQTNNYPNELPAENIWMFDPADEVWIQGPAIPENRRRGSAGVVEYRGKFYIVGGNTQGHDGGFVNYFDSFDPKTGEWEVLPDAPRARDHFFAVTIGSRLYVASGRQSGGPGGTFAPVLPEVDVYDFNTQTWSTLAEELNLPTPRAGAIVNNYLDKLIVAGGEVDTSSVALNITEMYDPLLQSWQTLSPLNFARHGTQGIVSGKGLYVAAGSPKKGGGNQKNMEVFGFDQPAGQQLVKSELVAPTMVQFKKGQPKSIELALDAGNTGLWIRSVELIGPNAADFTLLEGDLPENQLWAAGHRFELVLDYEGDAIDGEAQLIINWGKEGQTTVDLLGDGNFEQVSIYYNTGSSKDTNFEGNTYLGDILRTEIHNGGSHYTNSNLALDTLYRSERFSPYIVYEIPVPNGIYKVTTHHTETWFGQPGGGVAGPGKRVYDVILEGDVVKNDFDIYLENDNQPTALVFENIEVLDGMLQIELVASANNASISGISIVNQGELGSVPLASINPSTVSGKGPLEVTFSNDIGRPSDFSHFWDFGDGTFSAELNPTHVFDTPGDYQVSLTVYNEQGDQANDEIQIRVLSPNYFELHVNGGTNFSSTYGGVDFQGEGDADITFTTSRTSFIGGGANGEFFLTERYGKDFGYDIAVPNGVYTVKTYHNELWFGKNGPASAPGQRVYDIAVEGQVVEDDFDLFVANANQPLELTHQSIEVRDGVLSIRLVASSNNGSIAGFSIISEDATLVPEAVATATNESGMAPLAVEFFGSNSGGLQPLEFYWDFGDGQHATEADPVHTYTDPGSYTAQLTITDSLGNQDTAVVSIQVTAEEVQPAFTLRVNSGSNATVGYLDTDFIGEDTSIASYTTSSANSNPSAGAAALYLTERFGKDFTYSIPVANGIYRVKTYHYELWFGKYGPAAAVGQRVFSIRLEGEIVKSNFDLFAEFNNAPTELTFENVIVRDGELNINLFAQANNASISGFSIESVADALTEPQALILPGTLEGVAPAEITFNGSNSIGNGPLSYSWDFGDGGSSEEMNPTHVFTTPGVYQVQLVVTDSTNASSTDQVSVEITDELPVWALYLNAGTLASTNYQGEDFVGDQNYPSIYSSNSTFVNGSGSSIPLFQSERFGRNFSYTIPVENGTYRVRTFHNELWYGKAGPAAGPGNRVFDIQIEGQLVKDDFDIFVESGNLPTELVFENIEVTDGVMDISLIASANNASLTGLVLERFTAKDGTLGSSARLLVHSNDAEEMRFGEEGIQPFPSATIYPNPAKNEAFVKIDGDMPLDWIGIYSLSGQQVMLLNTAEKAPSEYLLPIDRLEQGVYLVRLISKQGGSKQLRLIVAY